MEVTRLLVRSDLARRWRSWLAIVVLMGLLGGLAIAAVAGWRRTSTAMEGFVEYNRPANAYAQGYFTAAELEAIPGVEAAIGGDYFLLAPITADGEVHPEDLGQLSPFSSDSPKMFEVIGRPILVDGVLPEPTAADEVAMDEQAARRYGVRAGDRFSMQAYTPEEAETIFDNIGTAEPTGPRFDFTVTGILRAPEDVVPHQEVPEVVYMGSSEVFLSPAFDAAHRRRDVASLGALFGDAGPAGTNGLELRVDFARTTQEALDAAVRALDPEAFVDFSESDAIKAATEADRAIGVQATLLLALGAVIAVGGLVLMAQGLRRQLDVDRETDRALRALGASRATALHVALVKATLVGATGAALAVATAIALSPLMPVGHARRAEVDRGVDVDPLVTLAGAITVLVVVIGLAALIAWRGQRSEARPLASVPPAAAMSQRLARLGMAPSIVAGVRAGALGTGGTTVLATVFVAALGIVGALGFAASEDRLATDPALWGWTVDAVVGDGNDPGVLERAEETLADNPMIEAYAARSSVDSVTVASADARFDVGASSIEQVEGSIQPRLLEGQPPLGADQVALGGATARQLGVGVGDEVRISAEEGDRPFTVAGIAVMTMAYDAQRIGEGILLDAAGMEAIGAEPEAPFVLVRYADGVDPDEVYEALQADWGYTVLRPLAGEDVDLLHEVRFLPLWFSALLSVVAAASLAFVLVLTIRRRRRDLALLRTLGFDRRQLRETVFAQAVTLVLPGALLGIVAGVVVGRLAWRVTTTGMGAPEVHVAPVAAIVVVLVVSLVLACAIAAVPARLASQVQPARVLRAE